MTRTRGFTLVEMLLATVLAAILMGGVLAVAAGLSRDRQRMEAHTAAEHSPLAADLLRRDLANALALLNTNTAGDIDLLAYSGIDPTTLRPNGRLVRVVSHIDRPPRPTRPRRQPPRTPPGPPRRPYPRTGLPRRRRPHRPLHRNRRPQRQKD